MSSRSYDLTGQKFGMLTAIERAGTTPAGVIQWLCKCDCGNETIVQSVCLKSRNTRSCGCLRKSTKGRRGRASGLPLEGKVFGDLTVVEKVGKDKYGNVLWRCKCSCGGEKTFTGTRLSSGSKTHCGCKKVNPYDLTGKRFGKLTVIEKKIVKKGHPRWVCKCDCGEIYETTAYLLGKKENPSCLKCKITTDLTGQKFGNWTVLGPVRRDNRSQKWDWYWKCKCKCGTEREVKGTALKRGLSRSCGCLRGRPKKEG